MKPLETTCWFKSDIEKYGNLNEANYRPVSVQIERID